MHQEDPEGDNDMGYDPGVPIEEDASLLEPLLNVRTEDVRDDVEDMDIEILRLVSELGGGGGGKAYRRERKTKLRAIVSEIYSPPRVIRAANFLPSVGLPQASH